MKNLLLLLAVLTVSFLNAQTVEWNKPSKPVPVVQPTHSAAYEAAMTQTQVGYATFYADYLAGKATAYGETYQPTEMTASHAVLPIGTIIRVTRLDNGQSVDVRINDAGGLCQGCIVTLSRAAADQIGLTTLGKTRVSVQRTGFSNWNPRPQRMTSTATARGASQPAVYGSRTTPSATTYDSRPAQPAAYGSRATTPMPASTTNRVPAQTRPATYRGNSVPNQPRVIQNNRIGENAPDFGDAYGRTAPVYSSNRVPSPQEDPNAYKPATLTPKGGATVVPTTRQPLDQTDNQPAVISREVTTTPYPVPAVYGNRSVAVPTPAEVAPVSEVQVATNNVNQGYAIQLAAYGNAENAMRQVRALQARGVDNIYLASVPRADGSTLNRVLVGPYADMAVAQQSADALQLEKKITGIVIKLR